MKNKEKNGCLKQERAKQQNKKKEKELSQGCLKKKQQGLKKMFLKNCARGNSLLVSTSWRYNNNKKKGNAAFLRTTIMNGQRVHQPKGLGQT